MSFLDFATPLAANAAVPAGMQADWLTGMTTAAASKIQARWDKIAGTSDLWRANVALRSAAAYKKYPAAAFVSRKGLTKAMITGKQGRKLDASFQKAKDAHDAEFTGGGTAFINHVTTKQGNWTAHVGNTLSMTGSRLGGARGVVSQFVRAAVGDLTFLRDNPSGQSGEPDPEGLSTPEIPYILGDLKPSFKAAFAGRLIQFGVFLLEGDVPDPTDINTILAKLLKGFVLDPTTVPGTQFIQFEPGPPFVLHMHLDNAGVTP